jgi:hypothetical protein
MNSSVQSNVHYASLASETYAAYADVDMLQKIEQRRKDREVTFRQSGFRQIRTQENQGWVLRSAGIPAPRKYYGRESRPRGAAGETHPSSVIRKMQSKTIAGTSS